MEFHLLRAVSVVQMSQVPAGNDMIVCRRVLKQAIVFWKEIQQVASKPAASTLYRKMLKLKEDGTIVYHPGM